MKNEKILIETLKSLTLLYIEDEDAIRHNMTETLEMLCGKVYSFASAEQASLEYDTIDPDIILSDVNLQESSSGLDFVRSIREFDKQIPIILLSAYTDTKYLLEASKLKLVAYLTKPISFEELKNTLLEATSEIQIENHQAIFSLRENIVYDTFHKVLHIDKAEVALGKKEIELLELLIKNKNKTTSAEEIKAELWNDSYYVSDSALKTTIHKLRTKIGKNMIKNLSGIGYSLNL